MFTLLKSGWSTLLRGDATTSKFDFKQKVISSDDESYIFVPNRKRSHVSSISNMSNGADFKVKKEKQHSPTSDSDVGSVHVKFASSVDCETTTVSSSLYIYTSDLKVYELYTGFFLSFRYCMIALM